MRYHERMDRWPLLRIIGWKKKKNRMDVIILIIKRSGKLRPKK